MPTTTTTEGDVQRARSQAKQSNTEARQTEQEATTSDADVDALLTADTAEDMSFEDALASLQEGVGITPIGAEQAQAREDAAKETKETSASDPMSELIAKEEAAEKEEATEEQATEEDPDSEQATAEDADATDAESEEGESKAGGILDKARKEFDDLSKLETEDDLLEAYRMERQSNDNVVGVLDADESGALGDMLYDLIQQHKAGKPIDVQAVARKHLGESYDALPDPKEDPEGYKQALREQARREAKLEQQQEQTSKYQQQMEARMERIQSRVQESVNLLKEKEGLEGDDLTQAKGRIRAYLQGDENGLPPQDLALVLHRGINADDLIQKAREEGRVEGRNEAFEQVKEKRRNVGDGIHRFSSRTSGETSEDAPEDKRLMEFTRSLQHNSDPLSNL